VGKGQRSGNRDDHQSAAVEAVPEAAQGGYDRQGKVGDVLILGGVANTARFLIFSGVIVVSRRR
jgi:hypothetical protein